MQRAFNGSKTVMSLFSPGVSLTFPEQPALELICAERLPFAVSFLSWQDRS
jgi:hypothetical protein